MKKILGLFIAGAMLSIALTGCSKPADEGTTPAATDTAGTTGAAPATPPATTPATPPATTTGSTPPATTGATPPASAGDKPK